MKSSIFVFFILVSSALSGCISEEEQFSEGGEVKNSSLILNWGSVITFFK